MSRIEKLKEFLETTPNDSFLQHALALEYVKLGDDDQALTLFEKLLANEPGYVGSYYHLGKLFERKGEPVVAIGIFTKGMEQARLVNDKHAYSELLQAKEMLEED